MTSILFLLIGQHWKFFGPFLAFLGIKNKRSLPEQRTKFSLYLCDSNTTQYKIVRQMTVYKTYKTPHGNHSRQHSQQERTLRREDPMRAVHQISTKQPHCGR